MLSDVLENYFDFVTLESIAPESQCLTLANQLDATLGQLQTKVFDILKKVGPLMQEALRKAMFHLAWSPDTLPTNQAVEPLFDYLHGHFLALNVTLLPQNFQRVLFEVVTHNLVRYHKPDRLVIAGVGMHVGGAQPSDGRRD